MQACTPSSTLRERGALVTPSHLFEVGLSSVPTGRQADAEGAIYLLTDAEDGLLLRLTPKPDPEPGS